MTNFISNGLSQSTFICEETLSSEQLRLSLTVQSFCKEITSFSAILGFATVQPLACFVSSSSFRFFSMFSRSSHSKIPFYHYLSSGLGYLAEGVCFPIVTDFASTGTFRLGSPEATLQGVGTILICKAIAKKIPAGNWILQHGAQSCALVSFDYGMEYVGLKEKENAGVVERLCFSELVAFRMSASAGLLGIACPDFSRMRARQQLNYELNLPRKDSSIFRSKKNFFREGGWEPKLVSANGAEIPTLPEYANRSSLPWNRKGWGMVNMSSDLAEKAKRTARTAFIKAIQKQREVEAVSQRVLEHPHLVEFRRYNDATRKIVIESWKAFHELGQPANVAYYKGFAKNFLESHSFIEGIQNLEAKAAKIKELVNIGSLCFDARHSFFDLPTPPMPISRIMNSEILPESRSPESESPAQLAQPSVSQKLKVQSTPAPPPPTNRTGNTGSLPKRRSLKSSSSVPLVKSTTKKRKARSCPTPTLLLTPVLEVLTETETTINTTPSKISSRYSYYQDFTELDCEKIKKYEQTPNSKGEFYFWVRNLHMARMNRYVSNTEMGAKVKRDKNYWGYRESSLDIIVFSDLPEAIHDAHEAGESFTLIRSRLREMGIPTDSFVYFLSESMKGMDREHLIKMTGVAVSSMHELFSGRQEVLGAPHLLRVAEGLRKDSPDLPNDFGAKLFKAGYPAIGTVAPEAQENPFIFLDPKNIPKIFQQDLRVDLYAKRMDQGMTRTEVGKIFWVSDVMVGNYERMVVSDISDDLVLKIGKFLERDPLKNYIRYRPAVLKLFELIDPNTGEVYPMTEELYQSLISGQEAREDRSNLRNELHQRMNAKNLYSLEELKMYMDRVKNSSKVDINTASFVKKLSKVGIPIDFEEILFLKQCFPDLSVRKWYEHFNYARLVYFLGRKADQSINYDFPKGIRHWDKINSDYILAEINRILDQASREKRRKLKEKIPEKFQQSIPARVISDEGVMRISRALNIDRRLLFFYLEKDTLRKSLELG